MKKRKWERGKKNEEENGEREWELPPVASPSECLQQPVLGQAEVRILELLSASPTNARDPRTWAISTWTLPLMLRGRPWYSSGCLFSTWSSPCYWGHMARPDALWDAAAAEKWNGSGAVRNRTSILMWNADTAGSGWTYCIITSAPIKTFQIYYLYSVE